MLEYSHKFPFDDGIDDYIEILSSLLFRIICIGPIIIISKRYRVRMRYLLYLLLGGFHLEAGLLEVSIK